MGLALTIDEVPCCEPVPARTGSEIDMATIQGCRRHEPKALRRFVVHYQRLVFAFISRTYGADPQVEDLAQEVFLRAYRGLPHYEPSGAARLSTWLLTIANRVVIDARKRRRIAVVPLKHSMAMADPATPETECRRREIARAFERAAAQLADGQRDAFVLAQFHGLTVAEIAEVLRIPENTAKTRIFRARKRLRGLLDALWER